MSHDAPDNGEKRETLLAELGKLLAYLDPEDLEAVREYVGALMEKGTTSASEMREAQVVGAERRIYRRLEARLPITYKTLDQPAFLKRVSSVDISGGGMRFVLMSQDKASVGDYVEIQMLPPDGKGLITVQAQVKRVGLGPGGKGYEVGVEFLHITDDHRDRINQIVNEHGAD